MAFREVRLPLDISYGANGGPQFQTTILTLSSGAEKRNIDWSLARAEYTIDFNHKDSTKREILRAFFMTSAGRAHGFRMRDWSDYSLPRQVIGVTDTVTTTFQIYKRYTTGAINYDRTLTKIVADVDVDATVLSVWVDNTLRTEGVGGSQFSINRNTGVLTLGATLAALSAKNVEVACEFDVPVRFDTDKFGVSLDTYNVSSWNSIPLVETREIT